MKKVFSASIDVYGGGYNGDAGTLYVIAESLEAAEVMIKRNLKREVTCVVGNLRENQLPTKYWPSETYRILGESEGLLFPVDETAEDEEQAIAEETYRNTQMEALFKELEKLNAKIFPLGYIASIDQSEECYGDGLSIFDFDEDESDDPYYGSPMFDGNITNIKSGERESVTGRYCSVESVWEELEQEIDCIIMSNI